jgi:aminoglycoside 6'-N-acetyltransferase I
VRLVPMTPDETATERRMDFNVRNIDASDCAAWTDMRMSLFPEETWAVHAHSIEDMVAGNDGWGFIAESIDGTPAAFAEISIRKYANGCDSQPVPFLEAIFVRPQFRRQGAGARLIAYIETFLTRASANSAPTR